MATVTPDPPSPPAGLVEPSVEVLFDYPGADVVLRSKVLKHELPEVHIPVSSAILSSLLTFISPGTDFTRKQPRAARLTLKFDLTIETLEDKLAMMPGAYLHRTLEISPKSPGPAQVGPSHVRHCAALKDFNCSQYAVGTDIPHWIESYISSIKVNPSHFDSIEFQMALAQHTAGSGTTRCSSCILIPVEDDARLWTSPGCHHLSLHGKTLPQAESELSILGTEPNARSHMGPLADPLPLPECLYLSKADIIVRTADLTLFRSHKSVLASSSSVFRDVLSLPQPPNNEMVDGLPVVDISEDAELVQSLITILILALLAAAQKYDMVAVQSSIRAELARRPSLAWNWGYWAQAFRVYAIASSSRLTSEMDTAARQTLDQPMTFEYLRDELRLFEGRALSDLALFRKSCRDNLISCFESFLDIDSGPSKIWLGCPQRCLSVQVTSVALFGSPSFGLPSAVPQNASPTLPTWVHDIIAPQIEELKQAFTRPSSNPQAFVRNT
ncbi:hypothetical protein EDB84DRAFT_1564973 [Lactarius hengduanensis]|nr:hypothetical protein EDB84DRAFT_1564973 [Lactarius hengduanensis]